MSMRNEATGLFHSYNKPVAVLLVYGSVQSLLALISFLLNLV